MPSSHFLAISRFLDPAVLLVVMLGVGVALLLRSDLSGAATSKLRVRPGTLVAAVAWSGLTLFSLPVFSSALVGCTETRGVDLTRALEGKRPERTAMVVLAAGLHTDDPSVVPPRERIDSASAQRVITAARLCHERTFGLVILSGPPDETGGMLDLMVALGVPREQIVLETQATDTRENATRSAAILRDWGPDAVVLVTSSTHLRRAVKDFAAAGVQAIPFAAAIIGRPTFDLESLLPSSSALAETNACLHELLGYVRG
jgi:uncharacterized SAM-binding protein YcdF (DUF218 family)